MILRLMPLLLLISGFHNPSTTTNTEAMLISHTDQEFVVHQMPESYDECEDDEEVDHGLTFRSAMRS